tara:strand:+ start:387 stop:1517 length:1131 start_codon:yes stop_codon:yes gene_type:complete
MIVFITVILASYSFEYYLTNLTYESEKKSNKISLKQSKYQQSSGKQWDTRNQYKVYKDLLKTKPDIVPYFYPSELNIKGSKIHSLSGVSNSLTVFCNENGYFSLSQSDRYGFNNPDQEWNSDEIEYVLTGDSFTHGYCVNRPNDIPSVLRDLSNKSVLNLGYGRNGPLIEYAVLREYLPKKVKKIIFMYYSDNDLENLNNELKKNILFSYIKDQNFTQDLKNLQPEIDYKIRKNIEIISKGQNYNFLKLKKLRKFLRNVIFNKKKQKNKELYKFDELEKILFLTKKLSIKNQSKLYFAYLPAKRYFKNRDTKNLDLKYFDKIRSIVERLEIEFIDINKEVFEKEKNPKKLFPFEMFGHYNEEGYRKVATSIYDVTK